MDGLAAEGANSGNSSARTNDDGMDIDDVSPFK